MLRLLISIIIFECDDRLEIANRYADRLPGTVISCNLNATYLGGRSVMVIL